MLSGVKIENEVYKFSDIVPGEKQSSNQWFSVCMLTGKNREVRKLFESQDLEVSRLKRVRIGPIFLPPLLGRLMHELNRISNSRTPKLWKVIKLTKLY